MSIDPVNEYLTALITRGVSPSTLRASRSGLVHFCTWWEAKHQRSFDLTQVVDRDLRDLEAETPARRWSSTCHLNHDLSILCIECY